MTNDVRHGSLRVYGAVAVAQRVIVLDVSRLPSRSGMGNRFELEATWYSAVV